MIPNDLRAKALPLPRSPGSSRHRAVVRVEVAVIYTCKQCGKSFRGFKCDNRVYCSVPCARIGNRQPVHLSCPCGKAFTVSPSRSDQKYCKKGCPALIAAQSSRRANNSAAEAERHLARRRATSEQRAALMREYVLDMLAAEKVPSLYDLPALHERISRRKYSR